MSAKYDVAVIGAGVGGLGAAALLARAGLRVVLLEARAELGKAGSGEPVHALDPLLVSELRLARHGLKFVHRDMNLTGLSSSGDSIVLARDCHAARRSIAAHSPADADMFLRTRREIFALARSLRAWWWNPMRGGSAAEILRSRSMTGTRETLLALLEVQSAQAFLAARFQCDLLRALLTFDATAEDFSAAEPGSALALVWRAAQEMAGLQGASAATLGNTLMESLAAAAALAEVQRRMNARVVRLLWRKDAVRGVVLEDGEEIEARVTLSSLSRARTSALAPVWGFDALIQAQHAAPRPGRAIAWVTLDGAPQIPMLAAGARLVLVERAESYMLADAEARAGFIPAEPALQCTMAEPDRLRVSIHPLPPSSEEEWESLAPRIAARIARSLVMHLPLLKDRIAAVEVEPACFGNAISPALLLAPALARARTPAPLLFLCGEDAEPLPALSGRAGRFAARFAMAELARGDRA